MMIYGTIILLFFLQVQSNEINGPTLDTALKVVGAARRFKSLIKNSRNGNGCDSGNNITQNQSNNTDKLAPKVDKK